MAQNKMLVQKNSHTNIIQSINFLENLSLFLYSKPNAFFPLITRFVVNRSVIQLDKGP
jgi:hypothetical protein